MNMKIGMENSFYRKIKVKLIVDFIEHHKKIYTGINITIPANLFTQFFRVLMGGE